MCGSVEKQWCPMFLVSTRVSVRRLPRRFIRVTTCLGADESRNSAKVPTLEMFTKQAKVWDSDIKGTGTDKKLDFWCTYDRLTYDRLDNCPLCDKAKAQLQGYKDSFILKEVDITLPVNQKWFDKYKNDIPVFHLNGQYLMRHKVHEGLLEKKLKDFETEF